jgi:hypothetical protein
LNSLEKFEILKEKEVSKIKAKLRLFESYLREPPCGLERRITEVYSYCWLKLDERIIIGWDNAPTKKK